MLKAGGQLMNLEGLIGADPYTGDIHLEILVPITTLILRNHSAEIEELRFAFFNALTVLEDYEVLEEVYDISTGNLRGSCIPVGSTSCRT